MWIILNADDFGKSVGRNRAIDDAFKQNLICSAGLIVTGQHLQDAINQAKEGGYINNLHLHFNLSTNILRENPNDIPLTETMRRDPFFSKDGKFLVYNDDLPTSFWSIRKWKIVYKELVAQFNKFKEVTEGRANYNHVDFHLWYNLTWPVSLALNLFTRRYKIETVRYYGLQQKASLRYKFYRFLSWNPKVKYIPATNIDYFLAKKQSLKDFQTIELYCHPNYKNEVFLDDSPSYLRHERQPLITQINSLKEFDDIKFVSWENYHMS